MKITVKRTSGIPFENFPVGFFLAEEGGDLFFLTEQGDIYRFGGKHGAILFKGEFDEYDLIIPVTVEEIIYSPKQ